MKKTLWGVAGGLALLVAVVLIGGALMSRTHVATSTIRLAQPIDTVWAAVRDFAGLASRWSDVERVERLADSAGREVWLHHMVSGPLGIAVEAESPPVRLVTRILASEDAAFGGTWTYELADDGGGTRVSVTEDGYINSLVFRFVAATLLGMHGTMDSYLRDLGTHFGAEVEPLHVR